MTTAPNRVRLTVHFTPAHRDHLADLARRAGVLPGAYASRLLADLLNAHGARERELAALVAQIDTEATTTAEATS